MDNGLDILLISDRDTDKSAAAIDIGIGSSSDPLEYLGLAHFHEHMLFLGSETYDKLDSFSSYISMNGGRDNAYTENMHTNFFFQVDNDHLEHSLDIFSHFFIDPLLTKSSMNDEIWAVDNEYRKDLPSQQWRDWRMLEYSSNPNDPFHKFTVGSIQTLQKNNDVYDKMLAFHNKWVKANIMKCVIYGKQDIKTLKKWATEKFKKVKSDKSLVKKTYDKTKSYRIGIETGQIYYIKTIQKQKQITYLWGISGLDLHSKYRTPVLSFINDHLLQSATNNSLYNILKIKLLYITSMDCDVFYDEKAWSGASISFQLTDRGENHINLITYYLYKYLNLLLITATNNKQLDNIYNLYFQESKCMDTLYFDYYSLIKKDSYSIVSGLAKRMQFREKKDLLYLSLNVAPNRLIFNLSLIIKVLQFMIDPKNVIIHYTNDKFEDSNFDETEPYFNIKFHRQRIPQKQIKEWSDIDPFKENDKTSKYRTQSLQIPPLNPYILDTKNDKCNLNDFKLINMKEISKKDVRYKDDLPILIINEPSINIWYKPDNKFKSPRININILLISPLIYDTAINAIYAEIWLQFINFYSSEWYAQVAMASYSFELSLNHQGIVLSITGLNQKHLTSLIEQFINIYITNIEKHINSHLKLSKDVLTNILISLQKTYKNLNYNHVWTQGYFAMYDIVKIPHFDRNLMLDIVNGLLSSSKQRLLNGIIGYVSDVLSSGFLIEGLFHGNIYKKHVVNLISKIHSSGINLKNVMKKDRFQDNLIKMEHLKLDITIAKEKARYHKFIYQGYNSNEKDTNDVVQLWFQFGSNSFSEKNYIETCKVLLLARMMKSECFQVLRTQESLGYVATTFSKSSVGATNNINYLVVMVASGYKSADYLHDRVKHFVNIHYYNKVLLKLNKKKFKMYVNGTINDLKQKYLRLSQETSLIWDEIIGHTYFFKWKDKYIEILNKLTLKDMITFYKHKILGKESKWMSIQLYHQENDEKNGKNKKKKKKKIDIDKVRTKSHRIIAKAKDSNDILYFNDTKDLNNLQYGSYFQVY